MGLGLGLGVAKSEESAESEPMDRGIIPSIRYITPKGGALGSSVLDVGLRSAPRRACLTTKLKDQRPGAWNRPGNEKKNQARRTLGLLKENV